MTYPIAEVPDAIWVPADAANYRTRSAARLTAAHPYDLIVIHITSGHDDPMGTAQMFANGDTSGKHTSAHFVVGSNQTIQCVALRFAAQHAHAANDRSIGVEHTAREPGEFGPNDPGLPPTSNLYDRSARLVAYLLKAAGLPPTRTYVQGHAEVDPVTTHTGCPIAAPWDWDGYMQRVVAAYAALGQDSEAIA